jgi:hypothetical protein
MEEYMHATLENGTVERTRNPLLVSDSEITLSFVLFAWDIL